MSEARVPYRVKNAHDASLYLIKSSLDQCEPFIRSLESTPCRTKLDSNDCFKMWSRLGDLRHGIWSELSASEKAELDAKSRNLAALLRTLMENPRRDLAGCLESGLSKVLKKTDHFRRETQRFLKKRQISTTLTSAELNAELFYWRDELGFALLLARELGPKLSPNVTKRIERLDAEMREILPEVLRIYRDFDDDPTPYPERFPESFWWRQLK